MSAAELYEASPLAAPRRRASKAEMEERAEFLIDYANRHGPVTVRGLYYQAEVHHVPGIGKDEGSYDKVQGQVLNLRRSGRMPYEHIADLTRWMRKPHTFDGPVDALQETARLYRKSLWVQAGEYVEVWCEKDALAGVLYPITDLYDVALMVSRGYASETFTYEAIAARQGHSRPYVVYYFGDCDRAGQDAARTLKEKLERFAAEAAIEIAFVHMAIEAGDIIQFDEPEGRALVNLNGQTRWLPTREPKRKTPADMAWPHPWAIELDAIEPDDLRRIVHEAIEHHLPAEQFKILKVAEESERGLLAVWAGIEPEGTP
jgi:hypothetical protein